MEESADETQAQAMADAVSVLAKVLEHRDHRLRLDPLPESHPSAVLHSQINGLLDTLTSERKRSAGLRDELEGHLATIEMQQARIREISAPIIEIARGVLCLPLVGAIDETQGDAIVDGVLAAVNERSATHVVIDVTGIRIMGASTGEWLLRIAAAVRLLGAECALTGIRPELASILVSAGFNLGTVRTFSSVRSALEKRAKEE